MGTVRYHSIPYATPELSPISPTPNMHILRQKIRRANKMLLFTAGDTKVKTLCFNYTGHW